MSTHTIENLNRTPTTPTYSPHTIVRSQHIKDTKHVTKHFETDSSGLIRSVKPKESHQTTRMKAHRNDAVFYAAQEEGKTDTNGTSEIFAGIGALALLVMISLALAKGIRATGTLLLDKLIPERKVHRQERNNKKQRR